jgi:hypothetical protein
MNNKFEQAVVESLQAIETYEQAMKDIDELVLAMDQAVSAKTDGQVRVMKGTRGVDSLVMAVNRLVNQSEEEDLPPGLIRIFAHVQGAPEQQREICGVRPSRAGYPIELLSFENTRTSCPDFESLEHKLENIVRDARFGRKLRSLLSEAQRSSVGLPASPEDMPQQPDIK